MSRIVTSPIAYYGRGGDLSADRWPQPANLYMLFFYSPLRQSRAEGPSFDKNAAYLWPDSETAWRHSCQKSWHKLTALSKRFVVKKNNCNSSDTPPSSGHLNDMDCVTVSCGSTSL